MIKVKLAKSKLRQLQHLIASVEGIVTLCSQNLICDENTVLQFRKEKNKLDRLFTVLETDITRYISQQQILSLLEIVKIGHQFIHVLYKKKLVGSTYLNDFLSLAECYMK